MPATHEVVAAAGQANGCAETVSVKVVSAGAEAQPMAHEVASAASEHFIRHPPHVGLEDMMAITPAIGPAGLLVTPVSSVIEHGA